MVELWALYVLMLFMIAGAVAAIEMTDLLSSVISVAAVGAALSIIFLMLGAPDLAITQVVVEVICLVLLIRVVVVRREASAREVLRAFPVAAGLLFAGVLLGACYLSFRHLTPFGSPLLTVSQDYLTNALTATGASNYVAAVLLDFRAYDTLGEATVIFTAIIGAFAILRTKGRTSNEGHDGNR